MSANMNNLYGNLVNIDNSHFSGNAFTSRVVPNFQLNPNALQEPASNVQGANSYIPCAKGGSKIHRKTKIHRKKTQKIVAQTKRRLLPISKQYAVNSRLFTWRSFAT